MPVTIQQVVDLMCLVYHEARNVRHPIKAGKLVNASKYARLANLPNNRVEAWLRMGVVRDRAVHSGNLRMAREAFGSSFDLNLQDLVALYKLPIWKHSANGGNQWASITSKVWDLVTAAEAGGGPKVEDLYREINSMRHNTGMVADKLNQLKT